MSESKDNIDKEIELRSEEFQEILGDVPSWILRRGITLIAIIIFVILIGSAIFKYPDIISTSMTLTATNPPASIVAKTSGKLQELNIEDNATVEAGEYLAVIENPAHTDDVVLLKMYLTQLSIDTDSVMALPPKNLNLGNMQQLYSSFYITLFEYSEFKRLQYYTQKIDFMKERISQYEESQKNVLQQKNIVRDQLKLNKSQYSRDSLLNKRGVISLEDLESTQNKYLEGYLSLENMNTSLQNSQIKITEMRENLLDIQYQYIDKKNTLETQLKTFTSQLLTEIQSWEQNFVLSSPINGRVTFTNYWTLNQNLVAGENVFTVIPNQAGEFIGKASMAMTRSGKVKTGQKVNIRFMSFPDSEFGIVKGIVKNISVVPSKNTEDKDNYVVEIDLPEGLRTSYKKDLPYQPEMQAQADIVTEDISLLERFLMPIRKIWTEGME